MLVVNCNKQYNNHTLLKNKITICLLVKKCIIIDKCFYILVHFKFYLHVLFFIIICKQYPKVCKISAIMTFKVRFPAWALEISEILFIVFPAISDRVNRISIWLKVPGSCVSVLYSRHIKESDCLFEVRAWHVCI